MRLPLTRPWVALALFAATLGLGAVVAAAHDATQKPGDDRPCLVPAAWYTLDEAKPQRTSVAKVVAEMAKKDVVLLGEIHTDEDHHRWQLQVLAGLHAQRPDLVIGFEMFPRRVQPVLDRWVAGQLTVREFLDQVEWGKVWSTPPELYLPLFQFARINRIPMVAANVDSKLTKAITAGGWDAVPESEREGVGRPAPPSKAYREQLYDVYREHDRVGGKDPAKTPITDPAFVRFVEAQAAWDRALAEALAGRLKPGADGVRPLVVGIMGSGHVRHGHGVAHQLRALDVTSVGLLLPVDPGTECRELRPGLANAVFALPGAPTVKPEPPRLGVQLEESDGVVRLASVTAGSLADRTGLKKGDQLVQVAGADVSKIVSVIAAVRLQPPGTWLPLRIRRGDETLDIVVKFPPRP